MGMRMVMKMGFGIEFGKRMVMGFGMGVGEVGVGGA